MPDRILFAEFVQVRVEFLGLQMKVIVEESAQIGVAVGGMSYDFNPVAGRDHHALFDPRIGSEIAAGIGQARFGDRQTLAYLGRCALLIHADELESHEAANLWMVDK